MNGKSNLIIKRLNSEISNCLFLKWFWWTWFGLVFWLCFGYIRAVIYIWAMYLHAIPFSKVEQTVQIVAACQTICFNIKKQLCLMVLFKCSDDDLRAKSFFPIWKPDHFPRTVSHKYLNNRIDFSPPFNFWWQRLMKRWITICFFSIANKYFQNFLVDIVSASCT